MYLHTARNYCRGFELIESHVLPDSTFVGVVQDILPVTYVMLFKNAMLSSQYANFDF